MRGAGYLRMVQHENSVRIAQDTGEMPAQKRQVGQHFVRHAVGIAVLDILPGVALDAEIALATRSEKSIPSITCALPLQPE